jgi:hypothetical protein
VDVIIWSQTWFCDWVLLTWVCCTSQKSWKILRAAQLGCGEDTVFVEYVYDTYMEGGYVVQVFAYVISKVRFHTITWSRIENDGS